MFPPLGDGIGAGSVRGSYYENVVVLWMRVDRGRFLLSRPGSLSSQIPIKHMSYGSVSKQRQVQQQRLRSSDGNLLLDSRRT